MKRLLIILLILLTLFTLGCEKKQPEPTTLEHPFMEYDKTWLVNPPTDYSRVRQGDNSSLNSFIFIYNKPLEIKIPIKNDCYTITSFHGDSMYAQGPHYFKIENIIINDQEYNEKENYLNFTTNICVTDQFLDLTLGRNYKKEKGKFEHNVGYSMLNALAIKKNNSQTYYINFGKESNQDENKFLFILAGLEEPENTCVSRFLGEKKCQDNEVMKRFQQTNCKLTWALWQPCDNKCKDGVCVD
jgi:hypothetical protein